jgi:hypothetical protein
MLALPKETAHWLMPTKGFPLTRLRFWMIRICSTLIMVAAPLMLVEAAVELLLANPQTLKSMPGFVENAVVRLYLHRDRIQIGMHPECSRFSEDLLYTLRPGQCRFKNREYDTPYRINSQGLRDSEDALKSPEVIFLGDSFTMGWGVHQDEAFPQVAAALSGLHTLNAGIASYGTARESILLAKLDRSNLKAIVIQYTDNDYGENRFFAETGGLRKSTRKRFQRLSEKGQRNTRYFPFKYSYYIFRESLRLLKTPGKSPSLEDEITALLAVLKKVADAVPGVPVVVFTVRVPLDVYRRFNGLLQKRLGRNPALAGQVTIADIAYDFTLNKGFILDGHWRAPYHRTIAKRLVDFLKERSITGTVR